MTDTTDIDTPSETLATIEGVLDTEFAAAEQALVDLLAATQRVCSSHSDACMEVAAANDHLLNVQAALVALRNDLT